MGTPSPDSAAYQGTSGQPAPAESSAPVSLGLLEVAPAAIVVVDRDGFIALANPRAESLFGYDPGELAGRPAEVLLGAGDPDARAEHRRWFIAARSGPANAAHQLLGQRKDGSRLPVEANLSPVSAAGGEMVIAIIRDVSEQHQIEAELRRSHRRLNEAQQLARLGSWEWDIAAGHVIWSDELYRIYGLEPGSIEPSYEEFLARVHPGDRESVDQRNRKAFADHQPFEDVKRVIKADGAEFLMRTQGEVVLDEAGSPLRMVGICEDVTVQIRAQEAEARLAALVQSANDAIYTVDAEWRITSWNPAAETLFGHPAERVIGTSIDSLLTPSELAEELPHRQRALLGQRAESLETVRRTGDGSEVPVSITMSAVREPGGTVTGVSAIARDISERRRIEQKLEHLASHDALTDLFNRRRFEEELAAGCARVNRDGTSGAVLLIDLDNFKYINDTFGHQEGDGLLRGLTTALRRRLRESDTLARLGGDEFAILVVPASQEEAAALSGSLLRVIREHTMVTGARTVSTSASIGVVTFAEGASAELILADVDRAMYESKDRGRDRVTVHSPAERQHARAQMRVSWEHQIREAFDADRFELYCQPIVALETGETTQCELLLRMHSNGDVILPGRFLPVAERSGLIHAIDRWVIARGIELAAEHPRMKFEINLSGRTLDDDGLPGYIEGLLGRYGADPANLVFEVTETAAIGSIAQARNLARAVSSIGCKFALDDFGAGFSTFYYLKHLPFHYLKIDGDFVASPRSRTDELVIESIVRIARELAKHTVAEFVGDDNTLERMRELKVDFAQGYHIGEPVSAAGLISAAA